MLGRLQGMESHRRPMGISRVKLVLPSSLSAYLRLTFKLCNKTGKFFVGH